MEGQDEKQTKMAKVLVVDTAGFIKNVAFDQYADRVVSLKDVITEIRDKETRMRLKANPLDIEYLQPDDTSINKIIDFARLTGDYGSISLTDTKVMALALMLDVELKGGSTDHLKTRPELKKTVNFYKPEKDISKSVASKIAGFYISDDPVEKKDEKAEEQDEKDPKSDEPVDDAGDSKDRVNEDNDDEKENEAEDEDGGEWVVAGSKKKQLIIEEEDSDEESSEYSDDDFEEDDDDEGWITPANVQAKKKIMGLEYETPLDKVERVDVACMTSDFAMQNILIHMGLKVASPYGCQLIKETKTWILRCHGCYQTTPDVSKKFCPTCGNPTLKRVSVTLNADGTQQIHINSKRALTSKGKKFSLPTPKGGKHAVNPILTADQLMPKNRVTNMAKTKTNAMDPDYICGSNDPFAKNDVTSKSAMMGVHKSRPYWDYKNPNAVRNKTGNKRKKRTL